MYPINVGLPKLIFAGADCLSGHVARVVIELFRLLFARLLLVLILFVGHGMLLLTSLRLPCASLTPRVGWIFFGGSINGPFRTGWTFFGHVIAD
jgi:hypothetical protein